MRPLLLAVALLLTLSLTFAFGGGSDTPTRAAEPEYVTQTISVSDDLGAAVQGTTVVAVDPSTNMIEATARVGADGKARFERLRKAKEYIFRTQREGYDELSKREKAGAAISLRIKAMRLGMNSSSNNTTAVRERMKFILKNRELPCGDDDDIRDRVKCRLNVRTDDYNELYYVPEECRAQNGTNRTACLQQYDDVQTCRKLEGNDARFRCVREKLEIRGEARAAIRECKDSQNNQECMPQIRERIYSLAKFKLYNLEERAEYLIEDGVSQQTVEAFITKLEELKLKFNAETTVEGKQAVLREALAAWKAFKVEAVAQMRASAGSK